MSKMTQDKDGVIWQLTQKANQAEADKQRIESEKQRILDEKQRADEARFRCGASLRVSSVLVQARALAERTAVAEAAEKVGACYGCREI